MSDNTAEGSRFHTSRSSPSYMREYMRRRRAREDLLRQDAQQPESSSDENEPVSSISSRNTDSENLSSDGDGDIVNENFELVQNLDDNLPVEQEVPVNDVINLDQANEVDDDDEGKKQFRFLKKWMMESEITQCAITKFLHGLHEIGNLQAENFPRCATTLMGINRKNFPTQRALRHGGFYLHLGLINGLTTAIKEFKLKTDTSILRFSLNIDGFSAERGSNNQFWPIQMICLDAVYNIPIVVALWYGYGKPDPFEYFEEFVSDIKTYEEEGIEIDGKKYEFKIEYITADAPARQMAKGAAGHCGFHGCERCLVLGERIQQRTVFQNLTAPLRTDEDFFNNQYFNNHQIHLSPLRELKLKLVTQVVLDPMHLICLGVVKTVCSWIYEGDGKVNEDVVLTRNKQKFLNKRCKEMVKIKEFNRAQETFKYLKSWKAHQLRNFILYTGPVLFKNLLETTLYHHFLKLHVAVLRLSLESDEDEINYADQLLRQFVYECSLIYGTSSILYNFHNLIHICADVKKFGNLWSYTCFPFENNMSSIKRKLHSKGAPKAPQIGRRIIANEGLLSFTNITLEKKFTGTGKKSLSITNKAPDNIIMVNLDGEEKFCELFEIWQDSNQIEVELCRILGNLYDFPCPSSYFNIYTSNGNIQERILLDKNCMICKGMRFSISSFENSSIPLEVVMPLLNSDLQLPVED